MDRICELLHLPPLGNPSDFGPALLALRDLLRLQLANTDPTAVTLEDLSPTQCTTNLEMEKAIQILRIFYVQVPDSLNTRNCGEINASSTKLCLRHK